MKQNKKTQKKQHAIIISEGNKAIKQAQNKILSLGLRNVYELGGATLFQGKDGKIYKTPS